MNIVETFTPILAKISMVTNNMNVVIKKCNEITKMLYQNKIELSNEWYEITEEISRMKINYEKNITELRNNLLNYQEQMNRNEYDAATGIKSIIPELEALEQELSNIIE